MSCNNNINNKEMELIKLTKDELLQKCNELGLTKYKSKTKPELVALIECTINKNNTNVVAIEPVTNNSSNQNIEFIIEEEKEVDEVTVEEVTVIPVIHHTTTEHLKPLIKWSGGKSDEIKMFEKYFPESFTKYIEPFIGGGSVYFYLNPSNAVISDVHSELIDLYKSIGEGRAQDIHDFMQNTPNDELTYYNVRDKMEINNPLDNAKRFYYQRKTCFRGMLRYNKNGKFNIPFGRYKTINYSDLTNKAYSDLLGRTEILNKGFEYIFENYNDENNFMFLDPPYDSEFTDYGYCQFGKEEQKKLASLFKQTKIKCLMIIGKTQFIEELYSGYVVGEYDKRYKFKLYAGRIGDEINTKHLIIKNY